MVQPIKGSYTTTNDKEIVIFLVGMRMNKRWAVHKWGQVFLAMPSMIRELYENKEELGFLSMEEYFGLRTTIMIQYWKSIEHLQAYAKGDKHLTAWQNFNKKIRDNDAVGIYHETYKVNSSEYESIYRNMPKYGLGKAFDHIPVTKNLNSAQKRLDARNDQSKKA